MVCEVLKVAREPAREGITVKLPVRLFVITYCG